MSLSSEYHSFSKHIEVSTSFSSSFLLPFLPLFLLPFLLIFLLPLSSFFLFTTVFYLILCLIHTLYKERDESLHSPAPKSPALKRALAISPFDVDNSLLHKLPTHVNTATSCRSHFDQVRGERGNHTPSLMHMRQKEKEREALAYVHVRQEWEGEGLAMPCGNNSEHHFDPRQWGNERMPCSNGIPHPSNY